MGGLLQLDRTARPHSAKCLKLRNHGTSNEYVVGTSTTFIKLMAAFGWRLACASQTIGARRAVIPTENAAHVKSRRTTLQVLVPLFLSCTPMHPAAGFENRLPPDALELKYKVPRTPGPQPADLGPRPGGGLKSCVDGKPHCFSTTAETFEDNDLVNADYGTTVDWLVEKFKYDKPLDLALSDVKDAISHYPPGQQGIDGGGFKLVTERRTSSSAYLYIQFESLRRGYIDDFEFLLQDGAADVRTRYRHVRTLISRAD